MKVVESIWLQRLAYKLCPQVVFPFRKAFVEDILFGFIKKKASLKKIMIMYMQPMSVNCLWTTYILICGCQKKCTMSLMLLLILFQMIRRWNMSLLSCLRWHTQVYFTGERSNLQSYANALNYIMSCRNLALLKPFDGLCLGHALLKGALVHYYGWKNICWSTLCIYGWMHEIRSPRVCG
jgi:hypothetical protein